MSKHKHRTKREQIRPFFGPVSDRQNPAAHGNVTMRAICTCGAIKDTNVNGQHIERGHWMDA